MPIRAFTKIAFKKLHESGLAKAICLSPEDLYKIKFRRLPITLYHNSKHNGVIMKEKSYYRFLVEYLKEVILIAEEKYKAGHGRIILTSNSLLMDKEAKESFKMGWEYLVENSHLLI